ncbi:hypothetical protein PSPO01_06082 [Paraphaeosphaeria sporulosa]
MARIAHAILGISRDSLRRPGIPTSIGLSKAMAFVVVCVCGRRRYVALRVGSTMALRCF